MRLPRRIRSRGIEHRPVVRGGKQSIAAEQIGQRDGTERRGAVREKLAAVEQCAARGGKVFGVGLHGWGIETVDFAALSVILCQT